MRQSTPTPHPAVSVLAAREVPLGGLRAMTVRRTLPHRDRRLIGAWCFLDHYGPHIIGQDTPGMDVAPHPHTGLQTVSWLFEGEIEHRDTGGTHAIVRPGELNLMTAGSGIAHSEVATTPGMALHGVQLWVALPAAARDAPRAFDHHRPIPVLLPEGAGVVRVFLGAVAGVAESPVFTHTPLLGAQLDLKVRARARLPIESGFEHGVLVDRGEVWIGQRRVRAGELAVLEPGPERLVLRAGHAGARMLLLGGPPFEEEIVMWWNFVARDHDEIAQFRREWEDASSRFGQVEGYHGGPVRIPAPELPGVRLRPRGRVRRPPTAS